MFMMILCFSLRRDVSRVIITDNTTYLSSAQLSTTSRGAWQDRCLLRRLRLLTTDLTPALNASLTSLRGLPVVTRVSVVTGLTLCLGDLKGFLSTVCTTIRLRSIAHRRTFKLELVTT